MFAFRLLLFCTFAWAPVWATAYVPDSDDVPVSATVQRQLVQAACTSSFSRTASSVRTWRFRSEERAEPLRGSVICNPDSAFKGTPARYLVDCERRGTQWLCDGGVRQLLVQTAAGVVAVIPNDVSLQNTVDIVQWLATVDTYESEMFGRMPVRSALADRCWMSLTPQAQQAQITCGSTGLLISLDPAQDGRPKIVWASWRNP